VTKTENREFTQAFRPRARLLQLLGDQLIGSAKLAVFELVKNAYDADAENVDIFLLDLATGTSRILIKDNGQGMSIDTIRDVWLVPGDDYREQQRLADKRSPKFRRLPLGEKGVGRFAVHKLGDRIRMVTKTADSAECVVDIDWRQMAEKHFLEEAQVSVVERQVKTFKDGATGTAILISELRDGEWSRREVRDLYRQVTAIASPFVEQEADFNVTLHVPEYPEWVESMPGPGDMLAKAPWHFRFNFDGDQLVDCR
jgi:anti-sigma regulatory factor (Ser/Thr protein kinase)